MAFAFSPSSAVARLRRTGAAGVVAVMLLAACGSSIDSTADEPDAAANATASSTASLAEGELALYDSRAVHDIAITFDQDAYDAIVETYVETGEKDWMEATVTIDGSIYERAGIRLKGNSSLFGLTADTAENPEELPWLISLDKYVDDQTHQGYSDIVIRSNNTATALNEAVALELLELAGLASQEAISTTFTVNGGETELRLAVESPDDGWDDANFANDEGALYKANFGGDYTYRGDDPDAYDDVFDQKAGEDDLGPLIEFLDFIDNSDDATFYAEIDQWLDVDAFATYLAYQDLVDNFDDIDGPGNNSYLHYDYETQQFTVVNWDLNLALGGASEGGMGGFDGQRPEGAPEAGGFDGQRPEGTPEGGGFGGVPSSGNLLSERMLADDAFTGLYQDKAAELSETLYDSGAAQEIIAEWTDVLISDASHLVDAETIAADADAVRTAIDGLP